MLLRLLRPFVLLSLALLLAFPAQAQSATDAVIVNGEAVAPTVLRALEARYGARAQPGAYWYDATSGAWGFDGGATAGFLPAGLPLGGPLGADASRGRTNVYVNGRRLPVPDLRALEGLTGPVQPGRYWLDAYGNAGFEGGPALVNLAQLARSAGSTFHRSWSTDTGSGSSGGSGYVIGRGWSVTY